mmetsp:Transcript_75997/g.211100  ORF Transcript_75997/g.211100 Transcript_75997/m.211100 type:complete len:416 (-) Transcript_75997:109-1356(-)
MDSISGARMFERQPRARGHADQWAALHFASGHTSAAVSKPRSVCPSSATCRNRRTVIAGLRSVSTFATRDGARCGEARSSLCVLARSALCTTATRGNRGVVIRSVATAAQGRLQGPEHQTLNVGSHFAAGSGCAIKHEARAQHLRAGRQPQESNRPLHFQIVGAMQYHRFRGRQGHRAWLPDFATGLAPCRELAITGAHLAAVAQMQLEGLELGKDETMNAQRLWSKSLHVMHTLVAHNACRSLGRPRPRGRQHFTFQLDWVSVLRRGRPPLRELGCPAAPTGNWRPRLRRWHRNRLRGQHFGRSHCHADRRGHFHVLCCTPQPKLPDRAGYRHVNVHRREQRLPHRSDPRNGGLQHLGFRPLPMQPGRTARRRTNGELATKTDNVIIVHPRPREPAAPLFHTRRAQRHPQPPVP